LDQAPRVAGDHPDLPDDVFSQRWAYTSDLAQNNDRNRASRSSSDDELSTGFADALVASANSVDRHAVV
jgi:hypothetical protein